MPILFQKQLLLDSIRGHAVKLTCHFAEVTEAFNNAATIDDYVEIFMKIFLAPEESELAESEFRSRRTNAKKLRGARGSMDIRKFVLGTKAPSDILQEIAIPDGNCPKRSIPI